MGDVTDQAYRTATATAIPTSFSGQQTVRVGLSAYNQLGLAPALRESLGVPGVAPGGAPSPSPSSTAIYAGGTRSAQPTQMTREITITAGPTKTPGPSTETLALGAAGALVLGGVLAFVARQVI